MALAVIDLLEDIDLERGVREGARDAGLAFRVMREARLIGPAATIQFTARIAPGIWADFSHPGPWSVSLEPRTVIFSDDFRSEFPGRAVRPLAQAPFPDVMAGRGDVGVIAVARTPGLAALAQAGLGLAVGSLDLRLGEANALAAGAQAVLLSDGRVVAVSGGGVLAAAERIIALEEAAQVQIHAAVLRQGGAR